MALTGGNIGFTGYQQPNYSGVVQAAGLPMQAVGEGIAKAEDYFKQQGEKKKLIKQSDVQIDAALKLFPDLAPTLQGVRDQIRDENISLNERAGIAESVAGVINMGTNQMQAMANYGLKKRELDIQEGQAIQSALREQAKMQAEANKPTKLKSEKVIVGGFEVPTLMDDFGNYYDPSTKLKIIDLQGYAKGLPAEMVLEQGGAFVAPAMPMGSTQAVDAGMVLPELQRNVPTLSKKAQATIDAATAGYIDGMPTVGLPIAQDQSQSVQAGLDVTPPAALDDSKLTPRGTSIEKEKKAEIRMTAAQVQGLAAQGFRVNARPLPDGSFMVSGTDIGGQAGETIETTPEGGFRIVRGGGGGGKTQAAAEAQEKQSFERTKGIIGAAADSINMIKSDLSENSVIARAQQGLSIVLPASTEGRIAKNLETVKILNSKEEVNKARAASPTGSAGGNITENEWKIFQNNFGTLEVGMHPPDLLSNLQKTSLNQFEAVNGRPEDVIKLFNNGKITKPAFDEYIKEYKQTRSILGIPDTGTGGPGDNWTKYNPNLLRFDKEKQSQLSPEAQELQDKINALKLNQ